MKPFLALIRRDLLIAARTGGNLITLLAFFLSLGVILPIAIGPDKQLLSQLGPALIWSGVLLSSLLGLDRIFVADHEDGSLMALRQSSLPLSAVALAKLIVHWLLTALPLIAMTPIIAVLYIMDTPNLIATMLTLLLGTPALAALSLIAAALSVSLKRGGVIAPILVMPLAIPIVIFGVGAIDPVLGASQARSASLFLAAISLVFVTFSPFAAALALRLSSE